MVRPKRFALEVRGRAVRWPWSIGTSTSRRGQRSPRSRARWAARPSRREGGCGRPSAIKVYALGSRATSVTGEGSGAGESRAVPRERILRKASTCFAQTELDRRPK